MAEDSDEDDDDDEKPNKKKKGKKFPTDSEWVSSGSSFSYAGDRGGRRAKVDLSQYYTIEQVNALMKA